jgi:hypothetical protein
MANLGYIRATKNSKKDKTMIDLKVSKMLEPDVVKSSRDISQDLTIVSIFRNRQHVFPRYFNQIEGLEWLFGKVNIVAIENDSTDRTRQILEQWNYPHKYILGETTGEPYYGSCINSERFRILAQAVNIGLDYIVKNIETEYVMFIESDIIYEHKLALLLKTLVDKIDGIVSPMVWTEKDLIFYDIWAFRFEENGELKSFPPYGKKWYETNWREEYKQILSAGTCLMFKKEVLCKGARLTPEEAIVGLCKTANVPTIAAYKIHIYHPQ